MNKIGLIVGGGTGHELSDVFKIFIRRISDEFDLSLEIIEYRESPRTYGGIHEMASEQIKSIVKQDIANLERFYTKFYEQGGKVIFRTAINAESLYQIRKDFKAIKTIPLYCADKQMLMVRDEFQGFYTNDTYSLSDNNIQFTGSFSYKKFKTLLTYSVHEADQFLGDNYDVWVLYKHHLFSNLIEKWVKEIVPSAEVYQPDTGIHNIYKYLDNPHKNLLLVTGNEIGDIIHEPIIFKLGLGTKNTLYTRNEYIGKQLKGLTEYQTIHGSSDDLEGKNIVNPFATIRAAAAILEDTFNVNKLKGIIDQAIANARAEQFLTQDMEGQHSTTEVSDYILNQTLALLEKSFKKA